MRPLSPRPVLLLAALSFTSLVAAGCKDKNGLPKGFDADAKSGPDGKRTGAVNIPVNTTTPPDDVDFMGQDQSDWKQVELKGKPGVLQVEMHWDNANADLNCDVFDSFGQQIGASPGPSPGQQVKKLAVEIPSPGIYFIRVQAAKKDDKSVYNVNTKWEGEAVAVVTPPPEPVVPTTPEKREKVVVHHEHKEHKAKAFDPDRGVQGRIVSAYKDSGSLVLHIDKGSAAGVKVGSTGTILEGPSGATALEGGTFTITEVIDENKSKAKSSLKSAGKNTRVSINTGK